MNTPLSLRTVSRDPYFFTKMVAVVTVLSLAVGYTTFAKGKDNTSTGGGKWKSATESKRQGKFSNTQDILEVNFTFDATASQVLTISSTNKKNSFIPKRSSREGHQDDYILELLDVKGNISSRLPFVVPREVDGPPPENKDDTRPGSIILNKFTFSLSLPWDKNAVRAQVVDNNGNIVTSKDLTGTGMTTPPPPAFSSISGSEYLSSGSSGATATTTSSSTIDLAFIGDDYSAADLTKFHTDVDRVVSQMLAVEPYKSRASQIMLHYVDNTDDLKCAYSGRLILCDRALTAQILNTAGVPYDKALIILNNDATYGGAGDDPIAATYSGTWGPLVGLHEFGGHSIGNLSDEYQLSMTEFAMVNCSTTSSMPASWVGLVAPADYTKGCNFPNYYRSSPKSLMNIINDSYFNVISQKAINAKLDFYAAPYVNTVAPTATLTSPLPNDTVTGVIPITSTLADDGGVARAALFVDGVLYKTQYLDPFTFTWPSMQSTNGTHTLEVKAYDVAENVTGTGAVSVTTNNPTDTVKPVVTLTSPAASTSTINVGGWYNFYATSTDNSGFVNKLELYKDGVLIDTTETAPYRLQWDTTPETNKAYKFYVKAYDYSGNTGTSTQVTITLIAPPDTTPPVATVTKPLNGTVITGGGSITVEGRASDNKAVTKIVLLRDSTVLKTCTGTSITLCSVSVPKSTFTTGTHTITENAYDAANNIGTSVITVTK